jgi:hypothetical protein
MTDPSRDCAARDEDLSALVDGELSPGREAEVRAHLEGCDRCRARMASFARVDDWLRAAPLPEVPPALRDAVLRAPEAARKAPSRRRRRLSPALGALAAAAAALALYLALRGQDAAPPGVPGPSVARRPTPPAPQVPQEPAAPEREEPPPTLIAEPLLPPALPPPPVPEIPVFVPELEPPGEVLAELELEEEPPEDLAAALLGVERPEDVDVIANLEILEQLLALGEGRG